MSRHATSRAALPLLTYQASETKLQARRPSRITRKTLGKLDELLGASGVNLMYAGYPYDPSVLDASQR
jgi:hypothetical protein